MGVHTTKYRFPSHNFFLLLKHSISTNDNLSSYSNDKGTLENINFERNSAGSNKKLVTCNAF